ncbi:MAG: four helix bundle protein [Acidobacteria bacterium]|nr:four helix bundle protein [Acidobacteriota bacterium]
MAGFRDFREIVAWQLARELKLIADALVSKPDVARRFKFCDQLSDAARSGPRNIAEGFARFKHREFPDSEEVAHGTIVWIRRPSNGSCPAPRHQRRHRPAPWSARLELHGRDQ